jgi:SAM-dependent methyltransferase
MRNCELFVSEFLTPFRGKPLAIADIGSRCYNKQETYRTLLDDPAWAYTGIDIEAGGNVDLVLDVTPHGTWRGMWEDVYDVVISGQMLEHCWKPWETIQEMARILKPGGLMWITAPNTSPYHAHPTDNWRFWEAGFLALFAEAKLEPVRAWHQERDTIGIARKPDRRS